MQLNLLKETIFYVSSAKLEYYTKNYTIFTVSSAKLEYYTLLYKESKFSFECKELVVFGKTMERGWMFQILI